MSCVQKNIEVRRKILSVDFYNFKNLEEYLNLNKASWAIDFQVQNNRRPTLIDFQLYFDKKSPPSLADKEKSYFDLSKRNSIWELKFKHVLQELGFVEKVDFYRNLRFLKYTEKGQERRMEIDFFFPRFMVGFEIQDLKTHSKVSNSEIGPFGTFKSGPKYHRKKNKLAERYLVDLNEIWEEEFSDLSGMETRIILSLCSQKLDLSVSKYTNDYLKEQICNQLMSGELKEIPDKIKSEKVWWKI